VVQPSKCQADYEHYFTSTDDAGILEGLVDKLTAHGSIEKEAVGRVFTHVKMTIIPDGGVSRLRVYGKRVAHDNRGSSIEI